MNPTVDLINVPVEVGPLTFGAESGWAFGPMEMLIASLIIGLLFLAYSHFKQGQETTAKRLDKIETSQMMDDKLKTYDYRQDNDNENARTREQLVELRSRLSKVVG